MCVHIHLHVHMLAYGQGFLFQGLNGRRRLRTLRGVRITYPPAARTTLCVRPRALAAAPAAVSTAPAATTRLHRCFHNAEQRNALKYGCHTRESNSHTSTHTRARTHTQTPTEHPHAHTIRSTHTHTTPHLEDGRKPPKDPLALKPSKPKDAQRRHDTACGILARFPCD